MVFQLVFLFSLLVTSALFSAVETAFTSLSEHEIHSMAERNGARGRQVARHAEHPAIFLTTVLIGNNLANIGAAAIVTLMTDSYFGARAVSIASGLLTLVVLIFCEVSPKRIAIAHNRTLSLLAAYPLAFFGIVFRPLVLFVSYVSSFVTRLFIRSDDGSTLSLDGILSMVTAGQHVGVIKGYEGRMVRSVFRLDDIEAQTVMTHRIDVFCLERSSLVQDIAHEVVRRGHSRLPVYDEDPERIVGIVLAKHMLQAFVDGRETRPVGSFMVEPIFVPEAWKLNQVFARFQQARLKIAVVIDEYGGFSGVVTLEDIAEEIFGEIYDETDPANLRSGVEKLTGGRYRVAGDTSLPMVNEMIGIHLPEGRPDQTLGAFVLEAIERIPVTGEVVALEGFRLVVERVTDQRIISVIIEEQESE